MQFWANPSPCSLSSTRQLEGDVTTQTIANPSSRRLVLKCGRGIPSRRSVLGMACSTAFVASINKVDKTESGSPKLSAPDLASGLRGAEMTKAFDPEILGHYELGMEQKRLEERRSRLELVRTQELLARHLPAQPAIVLDVGGAAGVHALWLARRGYEVHLIDPVPLHVEQATQASREAGNHPLASATVGD